MMSKDQKKSAIALVPSREQLEAEIDKHTPRLAGGFQPREGHTLLRVGKVRLGEKRTKIGKEGKEVKYPVETSYFVFDDPEVEKRLVELAANCDIIEVDGKAHVTAIEIVFPCRWPDENVQVVRRRYNPRRELLCKTIDPEGLFCARFNPETGERTEGTCPNLDCEHWISGRCCEIMSLRILIPSIGPFGVWQCDSKSNYSKHQIIEYLADLMKKGTGGQLAGLRFRLFRNSQMIRDRGTRNLRQHFPVQVIFPVAPDDYADAVEKRRMEYRAEDLEDFDDAVPEELLIAGDEAAEEEPVAGAPIVDEETGEITLPGEEPVDAELVGESLPGDDEPTGDPSPSPEPAKPTPKPATNEQVQAILKLAEKTWSGAQAAVNFKTWLGQTYPGVENVRQLTYQQAVDAIKTMQANLQRPVAGKRGVS